MKEFDESLLFSPAERDIWNAVFAATFVAEIYIIGRISGNMDLTAKTSVKVADTAIEQLREFRINERLTAGTSLDGASEKIP